MNINQLLTLCIQYNASDLHLSSGMPPILRIDGELVTINDLPVINPEACKQLIFTTMNTEQINSFEKNFEIDYAFTLENLFRIRANVFYQLKGISAVFRIIPKKIPTLDQLAMPIILKELVELKHGLILVTGATGSGKSTTLAAMIDFINTKKSCHIITIEDPIEFVHQNKKSLVNQRQVYEHTKDFNIALRSCLREDPDVILIGELRDIETIRLALTAAETGHLVLATLHTNSAPRTINRIIDVFPAGEKNIIRTLLSESLQAVICQSLVKKISGGRVAAFEIMLATNAIRNLIREDKIAQMYSAMQTSGNKGMITREQYLQKLVTTQQVSADILHELLL